MDMDWEKESENTGGELLPDGFYSCKVSKWEYTKSKTKGTDQVKWTLEVVSGEHQGATVYDYQVLLKQALWRLASFVKACNVSTADCKKVAIPSPAFDVVLNACVGRKIGANVIVDEYNKKKNNKVSDYTQLEPKQIKPNMIGEDDMPEFLQETDPPEEELIS